MESENFTRGSNSKNDSSFQPFFKGRLTRKILMSLPTGILLQSNVGHSPFSPTFEGYLGPIETRESTWQQMKELGVDGRLFYGYTTEESYDYDFMEKLTRGVIPDRCWA
jgi:hypothetical protein